MACLRPRSFFGSRVFFSAVPFLPFIDFEDLFPLVLSVDVAGCSNSSGLFSAWFEADCEEGGVCHTSRLTLVLEHMLGDRVRKLYERRGGEDDEDVTNWKLKNSSA